MTDEPTAEIVQLDLARKQMEMIRDAREARRQRRIARHKAGHVDRPAHPGGIDDLDV
jgi:hypothetical protein